MTVNDIFYKVSWEGGIKNNSSKERGKRFLGELVNCPGFTHDAVVAGDAFHCV